LVSISQSSLKHFGFPTERHSRNLKRALVVQTIGSSIFVYTGAIQIHVCVTLLFIVWFCVYTRNSRWRKMHVEYYLAMKTWMVWASA